MRRRRGFRARATRVFARNYETQLNEVYRTNPVGLRAVRLVAGALGGLTIEAVNAAAARLAKDVLESVGAALLLHGNAYVQLIADSHGRARERWDHYTAGAKDRTNGSITAWDNPGSPGNRGLLYSADDSHFFKIGGGTFDASSLCLTINAGGLSLEAGKAIKVGGNQIVGARGAAVADATDAASAITQLNALLARCRAHGQIAG